jgi:gluconate 2-dehydrogenase gamma chain
MFLAIEDEMEQSQQLGEKQRSRRKFLINSGYVLGGAILGGAVGTLIKKPPQAAIPPPPAAAPTNHNRALMFFTQEQFGTLEAAVERIFPADANAPGAKDLGVAFFFDHQLLETGAPTRVNTCQLHFLQVKRYRAIKVV